MQLGHEQQPELGRGARAGGVRRRRRELEQRLDVLPAEDAPVLDRALGEGVARELAEGAAQEGLERQRHAALGAVHALGGEPAARDGPEDELLGRPALLLPGGHGERGPDDLRVEERRAQRDVVREADHLGDLDEDVAAALDDRVADHQPPDERLAAPPRARVEVGRHDVVGEAARIEGAEALGRERALEVVGEVLVDREVRVRERRAGGVAHVRARQRHADVLRAAEALVAALPGEHDVRVARRLAGEHEVRHGDGLRDDVPRGAARRRGARRRSAGRRRRARGAPRRGVRRPRAHSRSRRGARRRSAA